MDERIGGESPLHMPTWTIGEAGAWIITRTVRNVELLRGSEHYDALDDDLRDQILGALISGKVRSSAHVDGSKRRDIHHHEWDGMGFSFELREDIGLVHRAQGQGVTFTDIRLERSDIEAVWPSTGGVSPNVTTEPKRSRGPDPETREMVKRKMAAFGDVETLVRMTEEAMVAQFGTSRDTCRKARNEFLSELGDKNSD